MKVFGSGATVAAYSVGQQIAIAALTFGIGLAAVIWIFKFRSFKEVIAAGRAQREAEKADPRRGTGVTRGDASAPRARPSTARGRARVPGAPRRAGRRGRRAVPPLAAAGARRGRGRRSPSARGGVRAELDLDDARDEARGARPAVVRARSRRARAGDRRRARPRPARWASRPGCACRAARATRWPFARCSRSRSRSRPAGRTPGGWSPPRASRSPVRAASITHLFPSPEAIAAAPDSAFAMPARRRETLRSLAGAPLDDLARAAGDRSVDAGVRRRCARCATATRGCGTDLVVRHALARLGPLDPEAWRPFRAYAVVHLWSL